jgi:hypothetical protein
MIKEKLKDIGRTIIGQGQEVRFKNDVEKYAKDNGVTINEAKKTLFDEAITNTKNEITYKGCIDSDSQEYRRFQAALNETFSFAELSKFRADASTSVFTPMTIPPVTGAEYKKAENYYKGKFKNKSPSMPETRKTAENTKGVNQLFQRFSIDPDFLTASDLNSLMAMRPDIGADIGKIMDLKDQMEKIEKKFGQGVDFEKSIEMLKIDSKELLGKKIWKDTYSWLKIMTNSGLNPNFKSFSKAMGATGKLMLHGIWDGSKIMTDIIQVVALYIRKKI